MISLFQINIADKKNLTSSTNTDTDSSVIFVGESKNIKTNAELHPEQSKFGTDFVHFVPETPTSKQTGRKKEYYKLLFLILRLNILKKMVSYPSFLIAVISYYIIPKLKQL